MIPTLQIGQLGRAIVYASIPTDPGFANRELLLHMDGADGSTTFTDHSSNAHTVTAVGNAQIDTAQSKWGGASGFFDASGDYLTVTTGALNIRTDSWCIEAWMRFNTGTSGSVLFSAGTGGDDFYLHVVGANIYLGDGVTNTIVHALGVSTLVWYHIAASFDGTTYRYFKDGNLEASSTTLLANRSVTAWQIGARTAQTAYMDGWIDDFRMSIGDAVYVASFTPPTAPFPNA